MPLVPLDIAPGLYLNRTPYASRPRWTDGNLVRFRDGTVQQVGGWQVLQASGAGIVGCAREIIGWRPDSTSQRYVAIGSDTGAWLYDGLVIKDITPQPFTTGPADTIERIGFGAGPFGAGAYGVRRPDTSATAEAAQWSFDLWGDMLLGCYLPDGTIYEYDVATSTRLTPVTGAPKADAILVSDERHLFALAADGNPSRVSWSDQEDRNVWTPGATNKAGGYDLKTGGRIRCGRRARGQILVWTDDELFGFFPASRQFVYAYERIASSCGITGPKAVVQVGDTAFWMGTDGFWLFDGSVRRLECDVHDHVFGDVNLVQRVKFHAAVNATFDEIWFFYVSGASIEIDRCVSFNYRTGAWSKHDLPRLCWFDRGVFQLPLAVGPDGTIYEHETGVTAAGAVMDSFVESHPLEIGTGDAVQHLMSFWPDFRVGNGAIDVTLKGRFAPQGPEDLFGPYRLDGATTQVFMAASARQVAVRIAAAPPGDAWELGRMRLEIDAGGLR